MSRIGKSPIPVPSGVDVAISGAHISVKGPKGTLERDIPGVITVRQDGDTLLVERPDDERQNRAMHGLVRSLVNNMVLGVTQGFRKELEIVGVGYRATAKGPGAMELALGFSHPVNITAPEGVTFEVPAPNRIVVTGIDKEAVGQVAADIRAWRKPEPYKGKGVRYAGEYVQRKAGKAGRRSSSVMSRSPPSRSVTPASGATPACASTCGARPSAPASPCSAPTATSPPRSSTTGPG